MAYSPLGTGSLLSDAAVGAPFPQPAAFGGLRHFAAAARFGGHDSRRRRRT
jgi:hypothetical protein